MTKQEQIKAIIYKHTYNGGTNGVPLTIDVESIAIEIDKLYQQTYLNECIEKATPNLSKIKDVDDIDVGDLGWPYDGTDDGER